MQFEAAMNGTAYLFVAHKVRTEKTNMIPSPADIVIFHLLSFARRSQSAHLFSFASLLIVVAVAGESTPVVVVVVVVPTKR